MKDGRRLTRLRKRLGRRPTHKRTRRSRIVAWATHGALKPIGDDFAEEIEVVPPHMTLDPPPHTLGVVHIGPPESRLEMPFLPLDGELLHREGSEDSKQQKPHDP
jgi:hypothetical protein